MAALKISTMCRLLMCVSSGLARPAICLASSSSSPDDQEAATGTVLREFLERELTQKLNLLAEQDGGPADVCTPACQNCLIICGNSSPSTCFANCTVTNSCFSEILPVA